MSSHCNRYPECNCPREYGVLCHIEGTMEEIKTMNANSEDKEIAEKIDFAITEYENSRQKSYGQHVNGHFVQRYKKPHQKHASNYTPPKKHNRK